MPAIIEPPPEPGAPRAPLIQRVAWFIGLAFAGAFATAGAAYVLKWLLR